MRQTPVGLLADAAKARAQQPRTGGPPIPYTPPRGEGVPPPTRVPGAALGGGPISARGEAATRLATPGPTPTRAPGGVVPAPPTYEGPRFAPLYARGGEPEGGGERGGPPPPRADAQPDEQQQSQAPWWTEKAEGLNLAPGVAAYKPPEPETWPPDTSGWTYEDWVEYSQNNPKKFMALKAMGYTVPEDPTKAAKEGAEEMTEGGSKAILERALQDLLTPGYGGYGLSQADKQAMYDMINSEKMADIANLAEEMAWSGRAGVSGLYAKGLGAISAGALKQATQASIDNAKLAISHKLDAIERYLSAYGSALSSETQLELSDRAAALQKEMHALEEKGARRSDATIGASNLASSLGATKGWKASSKAAWNYLVDELGIKASEAEQYFIKKGDYVIWNPDAIGVPASPPPTFDGTDEEWAAMNADEQKAAWAGYAKGTAEEKDTAPYKLDPQPPPPKGDEPFEMEANGWIYYWNGDEWVKTSKQAGD